MAHNEWSDPVTYLRHALVQNQFRLYCQPIAALFGSVMYPMAEVLVRLSEEETALLPPGDFLPVLEHYGMMPELDRWVVREALRRLSGGAGIPRFSINLSPQTIADADFPHFFADELDAHGVSAEAIVFEVDEHDAASAPSSVRRLCAAVGSLGSSISIDGFGRGQGKLASLALPCVQYVKLHGSLTRYIDTDESALARMLQILRVAGDLGVEAIAESVESDEVLARLRAIKVRYVQGFGVCVPHSIDALTELPALRVAERRESAGTPLVPVQGLLDLTVNSMKGDATWAA
jgi:EAL domain-containing protein (putative c-di-GMP-specific phosphodiesterase class I)